VPVTVTAVMVVKPAGGKVKTPEIIIQFSGAVNPATAANVANYELEVVQKSKHHPKKLLALAQATYDEVTHSVTLRPRQPLASNQSYHLRILGAGLLDTQGRSLDGDRDGRAGGNFGATLRKRSVVFDPPT
jgi:hypothetical protein